MRIEYICDTCDRKFNTDTKALECEQKHIKYNTDTKLLISHQPYKHQTTLRFQITYALFGKVLQEWNESKREMDFEEFKMDFEEFIIRNFESNY